MSVLDVSQFNDQKLARARIPRVAIVGTGFVGSTTAYALLLSRTPAEIVLIDRDERRADGHVQDLRDAEVFSHTTRVVTGKFDDCCSADVIIITAGASQSGRRSRLENLNETAAIVKGLVLDVARSNPHGILLIASNPVDVLTYPPGSGLVFRRAALSVRAHLWIHLVSAGASPSTMGWLRTTYMHMSSGNMARAR